MPVPRRRAALDKPQVIVVLLILISCFDGSLGSSRSWAQQLSPLGGQGFIAFQPFMNPSLVGALYMTPVFPFTGYYPFFPGELSRVIREDGPKLGPVTIHPFLGVAQMYTDNVFRTPNKQSDFFTTVAPGLQAQLPIGSRHLFVADYRTNIQFYNRTPSNNVQDQTATGRFQFNLASSWQVDLQGEHRVGHDPRGSALDLQFLDVNKWEANSFSARANYQGGRLGTTVTGGITSWTYLNNNQGIIRDRVTGYAAVNLSIEVLPNTSALLNFAVQNESYDQNKNLSSLTYTLSGGARWNISGNTIGEILVGYQFLQFTEDRRDQTDPALSLFTRDKDRATNPFIAGNLYWSPLPYVRLTLQPYRQIQQTVVAGTTFFTATGVNLSAVYDLTDRIDVRANLGWEQDKFSTPVGLSAVTPSRTDNLKNAAIGINYRAVKWIGLGAQYVFEDRSSTVADFRYRANTFMLSAQTLF